MSFLINVLYIFVQPTIKSYTIWPFISISLLSIFTAISEWEFDPLAVILFRKYPTFIKIN